MEVRNNVRQRRRERIQQITGARKASWEETYQTYPSQEGKVTGAPFSHDGSGSAGDEDVWERVPEHEAQDADRIPENRRTSERQEAVMPATSSSAASDYGMFDGPHSEVDPERWWKEKQRQERGHSPSSARTGFGSGGSPNPSAGGPKPSGSGPIGPVPNSRPYGGLYGRPVWDDSPPSGGDGTSMSRFVRGFIARAFIAAAIFGAVWAWTNYKLPGNGEVQGWTLRTVTEDMNFAAVEAWYERTFGGTPSYLPIFQDEGDTQAVSASWNREDTVSPLSGRIVQSFAQSGTGVRLAAQAGSPVKAIYTGRVKQVALDEQGRATITIQHTNNIVSVYGPVETPAVKVNDWVETGRPLGKVAAGAGGNAGEGTLEFAVQQDGKPIDPAGVVPFD